MQLILPKLPGCSFLQKLAKSLLFRAIILVILGVLLISIGAKISIPLQPVPMTLQSLAVLFIGMIYGFRLGGLTVLSYLILGFLGLPIFAVGEINLGLGYLLGFLLAAGLTGFLADHGWSRHIFSTIVAALLGSIVILLSGWAVLSHFLDAATAFDVGVKPFFLGGTLKIIVLAVVVPGFWRLTRTIE